MAVRMAQVKAALAPEEPKYDEAKKLGPDALPHLKKLVAGDDPLLAAKATFLAGLIDAEGSGDVVALAAQSDDSAIRVAAANSAANVTDADSAMFEQLLTDHDVGVRKAAVKSIGSAGRNDLAPLVQRLAQGDTAEPIRDLAASTARSLTKRK
jgi:HEAT repeat protein